MDKESLNHILKAQGGELLSYCDLKEFVVTSAFWFWESDVKKWTLIFATPIVDAEGPKEAYNRLLSFQKAVGIDMSLLSVTSPNHQLIKLLKVAIATGPRDISGIDFIGNTINNNYIEAAYIYRMS